MFHKIRASISIYLKKFLFLQVRMEEETEAEMGRYCVKLEAVV